MGDKKLSTSDIVTLAAGAVMLIAGFLAYWKFAGAGGVSIDSSGNPHFSTADISENVFGDFAFPIATLVWLFGIVAGVHIALTKFANVNLPDKVLDFTWDQIHLVIAVWVALVQIFWILTSNFPVDKGIGFWLLTLGAIALVVGAVLRLQEHAGAAPGTAPPTAF